MTVYDRHFGEDNSDGNLRSAHKSWTRPLPNFATGTCRTHRRSGKQRRFTYVLYSRAPSPYM